jgi:hypothetical protein
MLIYVLFLFIYREIGEFMDQIFVLNSGPFRLCRLKCLKKDTLGVKKINKKSGKKKRR